MSTIARPNAKLTFKEREQRIMRRAMKADERFQKQLDNNEWIEVIRIHSDGQREKLKIRGHELLARSEPEPLTARELKKKRIAMQMTQEQFARWLMVSIATVRNWEQKTGLPRGPALRLIHELTRNGKKPHSLGL